VWNFRNLLNDNIDPSLMIAGVQFSGIDFEVITGMIVHVVLFWAVNPCIRFG
jgi:hypothetical protein